MKKSIKEIRTMGDTVSIVRNAIKEIFESNTYYKYGIDFDLGYANEVVMTYDNDGRAEILSNGNVVCNYLTLPPYAYSSGFSPKNKNLSKLFDSIMDASFDIARDRIWDEYEDELIEVGIEDRNDDKLNYNDLYDLGLSDIAEELSEYEMDLEGTDLYTSVYAEVDETDDGVEVEIRMTVDDEYGKALVRDYKSKSCFIENDTDESDIYEILQDTINDVTKQF